MPTSTDTGSLDLLLDLLLHEVRTPLSVAQGYLRLLSDGRLPDAEGRERAFQQSLEAISRVASLCAGAGEYLHRSLPDELKPVPLPDLVAMLRIELAQNDIELLADDDLQGRIFATALDDVVRSLADVTSAALRNGPSLARQAQLGIDETDLVLTTGGAFLRPRLLAREARAAFDEWHGGTGLAVPLALQLLRASGARVWSLTGEPGLVAIAMTVNE